MKSAQAKIDLLIDVLVERLQDEMGTASSAITTPEAKLELEWLVKMSNLNNARQEKTGRVPGPQAKQVPEMSDEDLAKDLIKGRDPDNFPRRGPRNGKRENVAKPVPSPDTPPLCVIHETVVCQKVPGVENLWRCPECVNADPVQTLVSLKALL